MGRVVDAELLRRTQSWSYPFISVIISVFFTSHANVLGTVKCCVRYLVVKVKFMVQGLTAHNMPEAQAPRPCPENTFAHVAYKVSQLQVRSQSSS